MKEYDILFPANSKYQGKVHLAVRTRDRKIKGLGGYVFSELPGRIEKLSISKQQDYYITANTIKQYAPRRAEHLFSLNNIVLDFDIHERMNHYQRQGLIDEFVWRIKRDLFFLSDGIPIPNVIHHTGRGVQIWWHIKETSSQLLFLYHIVIDRLVVVVQDFLGEYPELERYIEIDVGASKNAVGLFRLFHTYNTHNGMLTETEILHTEEIDLNLLNEILSESDAVVEKSERQEQQKALSRQKKLAVKKGTETKKKTGGYTALHMKRLMMIELLVKQMDYHIGMRDIILFLAYNSALQCLPLYEARKRCREINEQFSEPLKSIDYIFEEISEPYHFKNKTFCEWLHISEEDYNILTAQYKERSMNLNRDMERLRRKEEKKQRHSNAVQLLKSGKTQKQVAEITGLSLSTVSRLSSQNKGSIHKEKPWEILGISRSTYYRHKKETTPK